MTSMNAILVVDDHPAHRTLLIRALRKEFSDFELLQAGSVNEASILLAHDSARIKLALIDLNLGAESGLELLGKQPGLTCPKIIISTSALEEDSIRSYAAGADCFLNKSADPLEYQRVLISAVTYFLNVTG